MSTRTTFHLTISRPALIAARFRAWLARRDPLLVIASVLLPIFLIMTIAAFWRLLRESPPVEAAPPTSLPAIMIVQTARAVEYPTAIPTATPDAHVAEELERLRQRVEELEARPPAQPQVVYVPAAAAPADQSAYHVANQPQQAPPPLEDTDMGAYRQTVAADPALAAHNAQEAADCDRRGDSGTYCQLVRESVAP